MCYLFWICWIIVWLRDGVFLGRGIQKVEIGPLSGQRTFAVTAYFEMIYFFALLHFIFKLLLIFRFRNMTACESNTYL